MKDKDKYNTKYNFKLEELADEFEDFDVDSIDTIADIDVESVERLRRKREFIKAHKLEDKETKYYQLIVPKNLEEEPLHNVIGHDNQKKELLLVIEWFKNVKQLKQRGISIPKGVILFGEPGNGKSLLIKEMIKCCQAPVFVFQGEQNDVVGGVYETFKKAREAKHAIIVFDELDLLIDKERRVIRALQENLDGVESNDDILVLAATNYIEDIPDPLMRPGRLEKLVEIPLPTGEEAYELLKKYFVEYNIKLPSDIDEEEVALSLCGVSCAGIKSIVNDVALRNGFENITCEMIDNSIYNITDRVKAAAVEDNLEVAIHEAGHAVVAKAFPQFFTVNRLNISGASGRFCAKQIEKDFWPYDKVIANIKISMAGVLSQKIICNRGSMGCDSDLDQARESAYNLVNRSGYNGSFHQLALEKRGRQPSQTKLRKNERLIERILKQCERKTKHYIRCHKDQIIKLGKLLFEKKHLKSSEILSAIG